MNQETRPQAASLLPTHPYVTICRNCDATNATHQALRHELLQEIAATLGVDLCNAFAFISGALQLQQRTGGIVPGTDQIWLQRAVEAAIKGAGVASRLLDCLPPGVADAAVVDLPKLLAELIASGDDKLGDITYAAATAASSPWSAFFDVSALRLIFDEIANVRFFKGGTDLRLSNICASEFVRLGQFALPAKDYVRLTVQKSLAAPADAREVDDYLTPKFLLRPARSGRTPNFAAAYARIRNSGGDMAISVADGAALIVDIVLPRAKWLDPSCYNSGVPD
jgi:hypothetical protein